MPQRFLVHILVIAFGLVVGCEGTLVESAPLEELSDDAGASNSNASNNTSSNSFNSVAPYDMGMGQPDLPPPVVADAGSDVVVDPCENTTCGANATCNSGACVCENGFVGDPNSGCTSADPCYGVSCPYGATCNQGSCLCDAGFVDDGNGGCNQVTPGDTAARTRAEVCDRWNADYPTTTNTKFQVDPVDTCDWGVLHPDVQQDALRRLSLFRWVVGLPAVSSAAGQLENVQACATTLAAESRGLTHQIPNTYACYTPEAAAGAGSSNLAYGINTPAASVDLYVGDRGVTSLGHRRWCLNPGMGRTAFGQRGSYSCMYSFDRSGPANPDYVGYPAPGFFPKRALLGAWSFGSNRYRLSNATVAITRVSDGAELPITDVYVPGGNYGISMVAWTVPQYEEDVEYEITIGGLTGGDATEVTYRTTITNCRQ